MRSPRVRKSRPHSPLAVLAAVALCLAGVLTACSADGGGGPQPATEAKGPVGAVPSGLEKFYGQAISWGECTPYATTPDRKSAMRGSGLDCARLTVPLDYANPGGETVTIGLLRHKATKPDQRIGSLVLNPGGPGASGMVAAASTVAQAQHSPLAQRFDIVGFDPRGVGASDPQLQCLSGPERDADRADDSEVDGTPAGVARQEAEQRDFANKCAQRTPHGPAMLANLGTRDVVKDMDVMRSALGDEKLTYLGYSYGTRIGYSYAEAFGRNVRAMVLDGAVDPAQDTLETLVGQGRGFGVAFGEFTEWCAQRQDCALGTDPAAMTKAFQDLTRPLIDNHAAVSDGRKLSYDDATTGAVQALYSQQLWERLNTGLNELKRQRGDTLMQLADSYNERLPDGKYATTQDVFTAVRCVDDPPVTDKNKIRDTQRRYAEVAPFLDDGRPDGDALDACAFWPVKNTSQPGLRSVEGVPPVLVISTTNDPATPYQAGVNLAKAMKGSLLTFEGTQHTVFLQGQQCVDQIGTDYLVNLKPAAEGARCG